MQLLVNPVKQLTTAQRAKISSYKRQGYELVNDGFSNSVNKNFDFDASVDQEFVVTLRERIEQSIQINQLQPQTNQLIQTIQIHQNGQIQSRILSIKKL